MFAQEWEVDESGENEDLLFNHKPYRHRNNALTEGQESQQSFPRLETGS